MSTNNLIGRVLATEKNPTTIDDFTFWTAPDLILNPFDIVKVQHVNNSYSYGVIEDIAHITDAASFLTNFIYLLTRCIKQRVSSLLWDF